MVDPVHKASPHLQHLWIRLCSLLWKFLIFLSATVFLSLGVNVFSTWFLSPQGSISEHAPFSLFRKWLLVDWPMVLIIGICLLIMAFLLWLNSHIIADQENHHSSPNILRNRQHMIIRLCTRYSEALEQSLRGTALITLDLHQRSDLTQNPINLLLRLPHQPEYSLPKSMSISQVYDMDEAKEGLLILGKPGAGKSFLLMQLAEALLSRAKQDAEHPIPFIFNLSTWAEKRLPLTAWIVEELNRSYKVPRSLGQTWIQTEQVLPLLDGLDEVADSARGACIDAINSFRNEYPFLSAVVCSRSQGYEEQKKQLLLSRAVIVQPLTKQQIDTYFVTVGKPLAALQTVVLNNPVLQELTTTPLMLNILTLTYQGKTVKDLPSMGTVEKQRRQIFASYIDCLIERRGPGLHYSKQQILYWLSWLAQQMQKNNMTIFYLEQLQPDWLPSSRLHFLYRITVWLLYGLIGGINFGLLLGLLLVLTSGRVIGLLEGVVFGLIIGLIVGLIPMRSQKIQVADRLTWSWEKIRSQRHKQYLFLSCLFIILCNILLFEVFSGLIGNAHFSLVGVLVGGIVTGLLCVITFLLVVGLSSEELDGNTRTTPNQGIWQSGRNGLIIALLYILIVGLLSLLITGLIGGLVNLLIFAVFFVLGLGLTVGILFKLVLGLHFGGGAFILHFFLRFCLWRVGVIPWFYPRFLDEATSCILLNKVGGSYSFPHRLLLDYFTSFYTETITTSSKKC